MWQAREKTIRIDVFLGHTSRVATPSYSEKVAAVSHGNACSQIKHRTSSISLAHFAYEAVTVDDALVRVLKIVRELVSRLIQLDVIRAGHDHHDDTAVLALLNRTSELRSFRPQLAYRRFDVVAHQRDRVMARVIVSLSFPFAVCRMHAHLARPGFENEPIAIEVLRDVLPAKHVTQDRPRRVSIIGVNQRMN